MTRSARRAEAAPLDLATIAMAMRMSLDDPRQPRPSDLACASGGPDPKQALALNRAFHALRSDLTRRRLVTLAEALAAAEEAGR